MKANFRSLDVLVPAALVLLGAVILHQTYTSFAEADAASGDSLSNSALFPRWIAWGLIVIGVVIALETVFGADPALDALHAEDGEKTTVSRPEHALQFRALVAFVLIAIYFAALPWIGFYLSTVVLMVSLFAVLGARPAEALILGIVVTILTVLAFEQGLNVVFPVGRLGLI